MLTLIMLLGFGMIISMFIYFYVAGVKYINKKFKNIYALVFAHIFYFFTFLPLFLIYDIILIVDTFKTVKLVRTMAYDKNIEYEDFLEVFDKNSWLLNIEERRMLPDKAFYVRNSK